MPSNISAEGLAKPGHRIEWGTCLNRLETLLSASLVDSKEVSIIAKNMCWNSAVGRHTQGISRLPALLTRFKKGLILSPCEPKIIEKTPTSSQIIGRHGFGQYLSYLGMKAAITSAKAQGVGISLVRESNWNGSGAYYAQMAADEGMIGFCTSNAVPSTAAPNFQNATLGTNPFAFSAPRANKRSILIDMAISTMSGSMTRRLIESGLKIPEGVIADLGKNENSSSPVLLPFGGNKGFALGIMVEILSSVITGSSIAQEVASLHKDFSRHSNVGHFFLAIDINTVMPISNFYDRVDILLDYISIGSTERDPFRFPGELRWDEYDKSTTSGLFVEIETLKALNMLNEEVGLKFNWLEL